MENGVLPRARRLLQPPSGTRTLQDLGQLRWCGFFFKPLPPLSSLRVPIWKSPCGVRQSCCGFVLVSARVQQILHISPGTVPPHVPFLMCVCVCVYTLENYSPVIFPPLIISVICHKVFQTSQSVLCYFFVLFLGFILCWPNGLITRTKNEHKQWWGQFPGLQIPSRVR